jgi:hypothetical protein
MDPDYDFEDHDIQLPNSVNSTQSFILYIVKILPVILGLLFGNQLIKYKRKSRKLAVVTEIQIRRVSPYAKTPSANDSEPKSYTLYSCEDLVVGVGRVAVVNVGWRLQYPPVATDALHTTSQFCKKVECLLAVTLTQHRHLRQGF